MRRLFGLAVVLTLALPAAGDVAIGDKLQPFALTDAVSGKPLDLKTAQGKKATVLMFISTQCPVSNAYNERMAALAADYASKGVAFIGMNANREETPEDIAAHARAHGFKFPILKDTGNVQADVFGAKVTPETYVYDSEGRLRYHGRIDDDRSGRSVQSRDLRAALDALLAGKDVPVTETKAFGCTIKRAAK
jgi:thiol-disulfide isomerase/thioredoxin